jgi:CHAT domain-containing protein
MWSLDDVLRYVPMGALYDGHHYLIEKYRCEVIPGAILPHTAQPAPWTGDNTLLAMGVTQRHTLPDPIHAGQSLDFPALPGVGQEMRAIAHYTGNADGILSGPLPLMDAQFNRSALLNGLGDGYTVVHIASHFDLGASETTSFLLLGDGTPMTLADLCPNAGQIFQGVDLLTLSACQTGEGVVAGDGHEVESLALDAQKQGARSVLASLWPVSDATTPLLMREFYRQHADVAGTCKAEALRQAELLLLHGTTPAASTDVPRGIALENAPRDTGTPRFTPDPSAPYAHPYYWAPFVLYGDWQ